VTGVDAQVLVGTSFRKVESNVGKKVSDTERVAGWLLRLVEDGRLKFGEKWTQLA